MSKPNALRAALAGVVLLAGGGAVLRFGTGAEPLSVTRAKTTLGINLSGLSYYATEYPFKDAFLQAQPFLHQAEGKWDVGEPLELRPDGYPARLAPGRFAGSLLFRDVPHYPAGDYTCLYDGEGEIEFDFAARGARRAPGRITVRVDPDPAGIYLKITRTDPDDPIRNIRLLMPGFAEETPKAPFHPDFLARWQGFSVLRFMDWMGINGSPVQSWDDRTRLDSFSQAHEHGIAPEYLAALCNELDADAWVCIPHRADDGYVRGLAALLRDQLDKQRKVYVEYSNETWNDQFEQADWCRERGLELGLSSDAFTAQLRYHSHRALEIFALFEQEFRGRKRLVRVLAAQSGNPWSGEQVLEHDDAWRHADALAIAPYFGMDVGSMDQAREVAKLSVDDVLDRCAAHIGRTLDEAQGHQKHAGRRRLPLIAYEAGQHLVGHGGAENHEPLTALFHAANRHPRMGELYTQYLKGWQELGGGLLCAFNSTERPTKWGAWGHAEHYGPDSEQAPKYAALRAFLKSLR